MITTICDLVADKVSYITRYDNLTKIVHVQNTYI